MSSQSGRRGIRTLVVLASVISLAVVGLAGWCLAGLPPIDSESGHPLQRFAAAASSKVYDRHGRLLFEMPPPDSGRHSPVPLEEVPLALRQAIIATEDATFYRNQGVDARAIVRALWLNVRGGQVLSGASTITQQLARTLLMSPEERGRRTLARKVRESILAWQIAHHYTKDQILELYLNEIYFGNMAYGVEAAAQAYYGKPVRDLDLAECALLAGLPQAPALYNPLEDLKAAKERQSVVLGLMVEAGSITPEQARLAGAEALHFAAAPFPIRAPHFVMYVRALLERELGMDRLEMGGLEIHTTLDLDLNETARDLVRFRLQRLAECDGQKSECAPGGSNVRNAGLVAIDPQSGEILAMLGSPDYFSARIDGAVNATTARRQPGSALKPLTYAAAFEAKAFTPASMLLDVRTSFVTREGTPYVPLNYDLGFRGPVRLREALASSYNVIAVQVLDAIGIDALTGLARRLGITTLDDRDRLGLAITLGGGEVRLVELTAAYAGLANGGRSVHPVAVRRVEDAAGHLLWSPEPGLGPQVLDERVAYLVTDILSDDRARIPTFGEHSPLAVDRPAAVKTGTTTDFRDNWTVGYTPELAVGVWVGNADNEPMRGITGISGAAPVWRSFMEAALKGRAPRAFPRPGGLVEAEVCSLSGLLPGPDCPHRVREVLIAGTEPSQECSMHRRLALDRATGQPAGDATPPERVIYRTVTILPPRAQAWAHENGISDSALWTADVGSAAEIASAGLPPGTGLQSPELALSSPDSGAVYRLDPTLPRDAQRIAVAAVPQSASALRRVWVQVDGRPLAELDGPPFQTLWLLEPGPHTFVARALTLDGRELSSAEVHIQVRD